MITILQSFCRKSLLYSNYRFITLQTMWIDTSFTTLFFSGHCCIQTVVLSIIDKDGFFDQCSFTLSKQPLTIVQYHTTTEELTTLKEITSSHVRAADIYIMKISVLYIYIIFFFKVHVSALAKQAT